ncbi:glycosyltransferase family 4 protein [Tianweitania populi]|uniref:Glycosyl transferase n=1 Tax=Tianweitania populi TaxID=1607949 RepID=A0A8J3GKP0_9HYPH|nr:glycosyltransferase [Tianweitania populi]GHD12828.1 glycosyl transferase [Tianweitania populi]
MKIAIVTPHPIPFVIGGAENLWWGLQNHIEQHTPHTCDIVSLVSPEDTLDGLVSSYKAFSELDLSAYDCVISGKYPAWMVRHPNHVCYMLHRLRGLYDTYSGPSAETITSTRVRTLIAWMRDMAGDHGAHEQLLPEFFERYKALRASDVPDSIFAFPGPVAREIVHFLDGIGLSQTRIQRYAAISKTVADRRNYFPLGAPVSILHPPPHRADYRCGGQDYLFTSSRLDGPKRVDLIIEAMRFTDADIPLLIAGSGPDEARLKDLAKSDPRIRFLGFVPDDDMPGLYADALAVPFVPRDEDYGLITVEAMRSGKPVVTVKDSGGPTEFVRNGETGFVTAASSEALGERLVYLAAHPDDARRMGETARDAVAGVSWSSVFEGLMQRPTRSATILRQRRPKLTLANTFPIYPAMGGGQSRIFHLYKHLADANDIDIVSLNDRPAPPREIAPGMVEIRIAKSATHLRTEQMLSQTVGNQPVGDIAAALASRLTPDFQQALADSCATSVAGIASHPYLVEPLKQALNTKPLWFEAHNVEADLKRDMLAGHPAGERLLDIVQAAEGKAWRLASHVFACTTRDLTRLCEIYGPTRARLHEVPNGVALDEVPFTSPLMRRDLQSRTGLAGRTTALFMGSWHQPNIEALEAILAVAETLPTFRFVVLGSVCLPFKDRPTPANVHLLGQVDNAVRNDLLAAAHVALNPMRSGSGSNLKMLDYFASGIPVLSTAFGARGLSFESGKHFLLLEDKGLREALQWFADADRDALDGMVTAAREQVEAHYSWETIASTFLAELRANTTLPKSA